MIYLWLCWVFIVTSWLSLGAVVWASHRGGFSRCGARAPGTRVFIVAACGLSSCGSQALEHRLSGRGAWA